MTELHPLCSKCQYDLTGVPNDDEMCSCPECGHRFAADDAYIRPHYIQSMKKPILLGSVPPAGLLVLLTVPFFFLGPTDLRLTYTGMFNIYSPATALWPFLVAVSYAYKINRYKGPDRMLNPYAAFFIQWLLASAILCVILFPAWLISQVIYALSSL